MNEKASKIRVYLDEHYAADEWPTLRWQAEEWAKTEPLAGLKLLDATPIYRNTLAKFMALVAAGAELYVPARTKMPRQAEITDMLPEFGIKTAGKEEAFDIILDCAGSCAHLLPNLGYAELTRSGVSAYERTKRPVIVADSGMIKRIETGLGTGESFFRAMAQLGYTETEGKHLVVVGYGKVGRGIVHYARRHNMKITVIETINRTNDLPEGVEYVDVHDTAALNQCVGQAWCLVTATGKFNALHNRLEAATVLNNPTLLANMGVDDEFGTKIPRERVLNNKKPLNFILEEPTRMCFIETTMALHNECALELLTADLPRRCMPPPPDVEERLLNIATTQGCREMQHIHLFLGR
ncbi:MAG: hypothetical protein E7031_04095 [Akkermansiaceae bacterium]|nr:hypothetical protein [Akkermansiaceae bacterium]